MSDRAIDSHAAETFHLNVGRVIGALEILVSMAESYCSADELHAAIMNAKPILAYWTAPRLEVTKVEK
jgi:hypothetical protein